MSTCIALFRGLNVGGSNVLPMKELVRLLEALGLGNVRTYIQSGNAVFDSDQCAPGRLASSIRSAVERHSGFAPHVLILTRPEVEAAVASNPFPELADSPKALHLAFLDGEPARPDLAALEDVKKGGERFVLMGKRFYLAAPEGIGQSKLVARLEKSLGVPATMRNWRSVCKIAEMARQGG